MAMFEDLQRQSDEADAKAAADAAKKADEKAAKETSADQDAAENAKNAASNNNIADASKNTDEDANKSDNTNADRNVSNDTDTNTVAPDTPATRGPTAVANALARHPQVDLDTALENHHATAGIPKQNLTHEQIYDAIIAEANFQKRQAIIQRRLHLENPDAPDDADSPKSRSP